MSLRLTPLSCKEIDRKLRKLGFVLDHTESGSARYYIKIKNSSTFLVQVHWHPGDRGVPIIQSILRNGGISRKDWINT